MSKSLINFGVNDNAFKESRRIKRNDELKGDELSGSVLYQELSSSLDSSSFFVLLLGHSSSEQRLLSLPQFIIDF